MFNQYYAELLDSLEFAFQCVDRRTMAPKKKLTKKERQRIEAEKAEILRIEQEKEKQRKIEEERERKRLERLEAERRQKQEILENKIRRVQLKESLEYFELFRDRVDAIFTDMRKQKEWKIYMRCNGLPDPADPSDIRKYIHMWLLHNAREQTAELNWLLTTNEMSVLTQDQRIDNMTRSYLKEQQHNIGDVVAGRVREVLGILREVEESIHDIEHLSAASRADLKQLKYILRTSLYDYVDNFAFRILSNIDRDMDIDGLTIARHKYETDVFKVQQWTLREAPQPPLNPKELAKLESSHTEVDFPLLNMDVTLPPPVKCLNTAIRVLWLSYDHFSDYCPSFVMPNDALNIVQNDICRTARLEWRKRKELLKTALDQDTCREPVVVESIIGDTDDIETETNITNEASNAMDADTLYANYENQQAAVHRKAIGPDRLGLKEFDLNMRKQRIVAGIFYVQHFKQPEQDVKIHDKKFLRNLVQPNSLRAIPFHQTYKPPAPVLPGVRRLPEEIEAEMREVEANLERLGSISIKLSEDIIWFEPPTVCRWESFEETQLAEAAEQPHIELKPDEVVTTPSYDEDITVLEDFDLLHPPPGLDLHKLIHNFVVPRMPDGYTVKTDEKDQDINGHELDIRDSMEATNSPRPLFPHVDIIQQLKLIEPKSITNIESTDTKHRRVYMFSKLLTDLDELNDELMPLVVDQRLDELSDVLSGEHGEEEDAEEEAEPEQDFSMSFLRSNDFPWSVGKVDAVVAESTPPADEDSDSSDESESADSTEKESATEVDQHPVGKWSSRDVHDVKFNEEKLSIQFKFGRMGAFALATNWYSNFPFQAWELKPDLKDPDAIIFSLTGSVISIDVSVFSDGLVLNSYQGGQSSIVQDLIGLTLRLDQLKEGLARAAINLFPEEDAFCYTEGTCEKNDVMEAHLYRCMAALGLSHNFAWSRWNLMAGRRSCVMLMREFLENRKLPIYSTVHVTPQIAALVDCTDVSSAFTAKSIDGLGFYADLHHLAIEHSQPESVEKQLAMEPILRKNVIDLLLATRPLSFS